jgi:outer membrane protein
MKRIITMSMTVLLTLAFAAGICSAEAKFGYVDVQKALNLSDAGKEAKEQLSGKVKKYQDEINVKQEELKKLKDELERQGVILSDSKKAEKEKDYSAKLKDFQRFTKDAQDELQGKDEELTKRILESFEKVVQEYGRKNSYSMIFARTGSEGIIFFDEKIDLTDELVKQFNAIKKK